MPVVPAITPAPTSFNRTFMELKYGGLNMALLWIKSFNRTFMELK